MKKKINRSSLQAYWPNYLGGGLLILVSLFIFDILLSFAVRDILLLSGWPVRPSVSTVRSLEESGTEKDPKFSDHEIRQEQYESLADLYDNLDLGSFVASADGRRFAYIVRHADNSEAVLLNGQSSQAYERISFMKFSPDGAHFAYGAKTGGQEIVTVDGRTSRPYDWISEARFFSPDSRFFIYQTHTADGDIMVINNWESRPYDRIYNIFISADRGQLVYFGLADKTLWRTSIKLDSSLAETSEVVKQ